MQRSKQHIPGLYISMQFLHATAVIKAVHCPPQEETVYPLQRRRQARYWHHYHNSSSRIFHRILRQVQQILGRTHETVHFKVRHCCCLFRRLFFNIASVSALKGECLSKTSHVRPGTCRGGERGCLLYILLPRLFTATKHHHDRSFPGASPGCCLRGLSSRMPSDFFPSLLFFSPLFLHTTFLTNTHQWPHSL